ncbi:MAG: flagellum-specific ATP synthase FliI, partial [Lachnospiraceae bacterium]|nr:flagellum-specific ATP synthase FliI [Lachnospiraceae bacterium]
MIANISFDKYKAAENEPFYKTQGKIANAVGLTLESYGPDSKLGDICTIYAKNGITPLALSEVVGFKDGKTLLMPYDHVEGVSIGCIVENEKHPLEVTVSDDLLGLTLNGIGVPDGGVEVKGKKYPIEANPPDPMKRKIIDEVLPLGVKAVDGLLTIGKGQRIGIFAGSGVGKSTLLGMFARNTKADINVIALIGERGREVREFVER